MDQQENKDRPAKEVWVVSNIGGAVYVAPFRQAAMDHALDMAGDFPEEGPWRVCRYVAEPFTGDHRLQELLGYLKDFQAGINPGTINITNSVRGIVQTLINWIEDAEKDN